MKESHRAFGEDGFDSFHFLIEYGWGCGCCFHKTDIGSEPFALLSVFFFLILFLLSFLVGSSSSFFM